MQKIASQVEAKAKDTITCKTPSPFLMQMLADYPSLLQQNLVKPFSPLPLRVRYCCTVQASTCTQFYVGLHEYLWN